MAIGISILLIAAGAVLTWAVDLSVSGVDMDVVGIIMMIVGAIGVVVGITVGRTGWGRHDVVERRAVR